MIQVKKVAVSLLFLAIVAALTTPAFSASTPNIQVSRTSGVAPLAVFFDATGTTSTATNKPFHELHYAWDFNDSGSGNWSITGKSKNKAYGPVAAHVFETPGTYNVKLTIRETNGSVSNRQVTITVQNPNSVFSGAKTVCFSTSGNFNGCPSGAKRVTGSSLNAVRNHIASNRRLLLRGGESFTGGSSGVIRITTPGPGTISAYGGGRPNLGATIRIDNDNPDWRVVGLRFTGGEDLVFDIRDADNTLVMRNVGQAGRFDSGIHLNFNYFNGGVRDLPQGIFFIDNDVRNVGSAIIYMAAAKLALMGNRLDGAPNSHVIRLSHVEKAVISNNYVARQRNGNGLLTIRNADHGGPQFFAGRPSGEIVVSDNFFYPSSVNGIGTFVGKNSGGHTVSGRDLIFERNFVERDPGSPGIVDKAWGATPEAVGVTVRNNVVIMNNWSSHSAFVGNGSGQHFYNNTCYSTDTDNIRCVKFLGSGTDRVASNNLAYGPNATNNDGGISGLANNGSNLLLKGKNPFNSTSFSAPDDFILKSTSKAVNAGRNVPIVDDLFNNFRPSGSRYDVGAVESGATGGGSGSGPGSGGSLGSSMAAILQLLLE